jgi:hypothetical protein
MACIVLLAACSGPGGTATASSTGTASTSGSPSGTSASSPTTVASATAVEIPSLSAEPSAEPTEDALPAFSCTFPIHGDGTVARAQLTDVRVGTHDDYDRIVFQYENGVPELDITRATPPLLADASGMELNVDGNFFLQILMHGATKQTDAGGSSYTGSTDFTPGFDQLAELIEGGDFEAVNTWYAGLNADACVRAFTLGNPSRIVVDIEH